MIGVGLDVAFDHFKSMIAELPTVIEIFSPSSVKAFKLSV